MANNYFKALRELENENKGCTIDIDIIDSENNKYHIAYDTYYLVICKGLSTEYLDTEYNNDNTSLTKSELLSFISAFLNRANKYDNLNEWYSTSNVVCKGSKTINGNKYQYEVRFND